MSVITLGAMLTVPASAYATPEFDVPATLSTITGVLSLILAVAMLLVVVQLRRVASGSAIASRITFIVAGAVSLAASVLLGFVDRFVASWLSEGQVRAASDLLVLAATVFFTLYFDAVRRALVGFLGGLRDDEQDAETSERELARVNGEAIDA